MKKVFAITAHRITNPLCFFVNYISSFDNNLIIIHIDKKSDKKIFIEKLNKKNVIFVKNRLNIRWGGVSQIRATLVLLKEALKLGFDYFFLLSGDDIPLKSNKEMDFFLEAHKGENFFHFNENADLYKERVEFNYPIFFFQKNKSFLIKILIGLHKIFRNIFFKNKIFNERGLSFKYYKGDSWFGVDFDSAGKIIDFLRRNPWYLKMYKKSFCGDEIFFHTIAKKINLNNFEKPLRNNALRYIDWISGPDYPKIIDENDVDKIKKSDMFFVRKIHPNADFHFMHQFIEERHR